MKKTNSVNVFELLGRINNDFGNHVFIARSIPSVDVKFFGSMGKRTIKIHTYESDQPECMVGNLEIEWDSKLPRPVYHIKSDTEQTYDNETTKWNELEFDTTDIFQVISEILGVMVCDDDSCHDEDPTECWESGMFPDDYYDHCLKTRTGIFKGINKNTVLTIPWF